MSRNHFSERILKGFILSSDALFEIRHLLDRRQKTMFSEGLSPEAKLVLQQMREDTRVRFNEDSDGNSAGDEGAGEYTSRSVQKIKKSSKKVAARDKSRRQISFTDSNTKGNNRISKLVDETHDLSTNTADKNKVNLSSTTGGDVKGKQNVGGGSDVLAVDLNPVDKCREWVTVNDVEITSGT